jgi:Xaa-Pro aminopeptidase
VDTRRDKLPRLIRHLDTIRARVRDAGADGLWVHPSVDFRYLTGLELLSIERPAGLLIPAQGDVRAAAPAMFAEPLAGIDAALWSDADGPDDALARVLGGVRTLLVAPSLPTGQAFLLRRLLPALELELDPGIVAALRRRKTPEEIERLAEAGRRADEAVGWIGTLPLDGWSERRLAGELQAHFLQGGAQPYDPIVATGPNAALPHHETGDAPIARDAPLLTDFGCVVDGYYSDITRVHFPADVDAEVEEAWALVLEAYGAAERAAGPGVPAREVDRAARDVFAAAGVADRFVHRIGHGLGMDVHEEPYLTGANDEPLAVGDVFSIEPGLYVPGRYGLRYENTVALTEDGLVTLNHAPQRPALA